MPTVNVFQNEGLIGLRWPDHAIELCKFIADQLSCDQKQLNYKEISLRLITTHNLAMITPVEVEIKAHAYADRITRADQICSNIRSFLKDRIVVNEDVCVWLALSELGHSWEIE
jgi:hypothetical protein